LTLKGERDGKETRQREKARERREGERERERERREIMKGEVITKGQKGAWWWWMFTVWAP
jgi:hypothetical protein